VRAAGPFSGVQEQGFLTGLYTDPNATNQGSASDQKARLLLESDWVRCSMAGDLASFRFVDRNGSSITCDQLDYNGQSAGYTADPQEIINYIEAHDNETLFRRAAVQAAGLRFPSPQRVRVQKPRHVDPGVLAGYPVLPCRRRSCCARSRATANSYNSRRLVQQTRLHLWCEHWGVGLPPQGDNGGNWDLLRPLLGNPSLKTGSSRHPRFLRAHGRGARHSKLTPLLRLRTAADINSKVQMLKRGPDQVPGVIVMTISDPSGSVDRQHDSSPCCSMPHPWPRASRPQTLAGRNLTNPSRFISCRSIAIVKTSTFNRATGTFTIPADGGGLLVVASTPGGDH